MLHVSSGLLLFYMHYVLSYNFCNKFDFNVLGTQFVSFGHVRLCNDCGKQINSEISKTRNLCFVFSALHVQNSIRKMKDVCYMVFRKNNTALNVLI